MFEIFDYGVERSGEHVVLVTPPLPEEIMTTLAAKVEFTAEKTAITASYMHRMQSFNQHSKDAELLRFAIETPEQGAEIVSPIDALASLTKDIETEFKQARHTI